MAQDNARDREVQRYYEPWIESCHSSSLPTRTLNSRQDGHKPRPSPDTALVAFTQLGALKLNANRSVVTLIGNEYQYILAEASRSSNLLDGTSHVQGEELWWGTAKIPLGQGISEDALHPSEYVAHGPGQKEYRAPAVVVSDLSQTESCRARGCSGPGVRFYAGVPIVTKRGYAIGVYMVADGKPRNGLNAQELKTLVELSSIVLQHLDTIRSDRARARGELLIHGIGSFIKGHATTRATPSLPPHSSTNKDPMEGGDTHGPPDSTPDADSSPPARGLHSSTDGPPVANASYAARTESAVPDGEDVSQVRPSISNAATPRSEDKLQYDHKPAAEDQPKPATTTSRHDSSSSQKSGPSRDAVFQRASRILLECMDADGVAFIDASTANMNRGSSKAKSHRAMFGSRRSQNSQNGQQESQTLSRQLSQTSSDGEAAADGSKSAVAAEHNFDDMAKSSSAPHRLCDVLAMTTETPHSLAEIELSEPSLRELIASYPQPHCFVFDEKGHSASYRVTGDSDSTAKVRSADGNGPDPRATFDGSPRKSHHALLDILPGARTIVFLPLWDHIRLQWNSAVIVWSTDPLRLIHVQDHLPYVTAFSLAVIGEVSRLSITASDKAKALFLANISHELRSPLHGILGSIEFLHDTLLDDFQSNMVISVETCGKTLLDTISHVLDFAKLNSLSTQNSNKKEITQATTSDSSLTSIFDLAIVVEEAVEAVYAGQVFRRTNAEALEGNGPPLSSSSKAMAQRQNTRDMIAQGQAVTSEAVRLTLNIENSPHWCVTSQPGAIRRIVMNLLGNALKYTDEGSIDVSLQVDKSPKGGDNSVRHSVLAVSDTGRGMSEDFVRNQMFTPFSQEDTLASGTGLGLSIIRQIVDSLGGKIDVRSQKGLGTEIKVWLSLFTVNSQSSEDCSSDEKNTIWQMQRGTKGCRMCLLSPKLSDQERIKEVPSLRQMPSVDQSIRNLLARWFFMEVFSAPSMEDQRSDFFIYTEPPSIEHLLDQHGSHPSLKEVPVIIICQNAFQANSLRANGIHLLTDIGRIIEIIAQPLGPQKLAKVLHRCMQRTRKLEKPSKARSSDHVSLSLRTSDDAQHSQSPFGEAEPALQDGHTQPPSQLHEISQSSSAGTSNSSEVSAPRRPEAKPLLQPSVDPSLPRVLLVDDNQINLQLLIAFVRRTKHPFESATDGQQALDLYKQSVSSSNPFKYILMDINMPVMNGSKATKEIREYENDRGIESRVKVIALTGMGDESDAKKEAQDIGFDLFLSKPVKFKQLTDLLI